ncbi:MAG: glycosyltransferase family 4 protein [Candidatus Nomurabacteria bacterium]|jgi:glycosyltransferase involved in cell wall biosynthesis|nr:glycosyltransferase family 4 protein [Candidatus Nomurabacteria bacterium]
MSSSTRLLVKNILALSDRSVLGDCSDLVACLPVYGEAIFLQFKKDIDKSGIIQYNDWIGGTGLKILMLGWELPPHNSGGLGVACYHLAKSLAKAGANISFVLPYTAKHDVDFMEIIHATSLDPIHRFGASAYDSKNITSDIIEGKELGERLSLRDIQRFYGDFVDKHVEGKDFDVIHSHDWLTLEAGAIAKRKLGVPLIAHVHATEFDRGDLEHGGNPIIHEIEREGLLLADKIIAVSQMTKDLIVAKYNIPDDKIEVAHNGPNPIDRDYQFENSNYQFLEKKKQAGWAVVSAIARLTVQKGLSHLIRATAMATKFNPKIILLIAGDGELRDELLELSADLGIAKNVAFTGFVRGQELRDIYAISDIFVMSSRSEPFGITALEAASSDNAVILTKQSGVSEVLLNVLRYDYWDEKRLAELLVATSGSTALTTEMKINVTKEYLKISWNDIAKKIMDIYNKTMQRRRNY